VYLNNTEKVISQTVQELEENSHLYNPGNTQHCAQHFFSRKHKEEIA